MNNMIQIYIFICLMLLFFNIVFVMVKSAKKNKLYHKKNQFLKLIQREKEYFEKEKGFSSVFKARVLKQLNQTKKLVVIQNEWSSTPHMMEALRPYLLNNIHAYRQKGEDEQAFYAYVLATLPYTEHKLPTTFTIAFMQFLESKSLYTFSNAMLAIYQFGDPYLMLQAIDKVDEREGFYHKKLFVDGMLTYAGDTTVLHELIRNRWQGYKVPTQESLIDYFRIKGEDIGAFGVTYLKSDEVEEQVKYAMLRYFAKYPNAEARTWGLGILQDDTSVWVEQMLAIQMLKNYKDDIVRQTVEGKITSPNWYIRCHALTYLKDLHMDQQAILNILTLRDRYTNETLLYQYKDNKEMTQYINNTIEELDKEATVSYMQA